jgi:predicted transposase YbfD/YdcC
MVLGQRKVEVKNNEITAIPALLDVLMLKECIVTIDAIGCQKDIAEKIISKQADYILGTKRQSGAFVRRCAGSFHPAQSRRIQFGRAGYGSWTH